MFWYPEGPGLDIRIETDVAVHDRRPCQHQWRAEVSDSKYECTSHGTCRDESLDGILYLNEIHISVIRKPHSGYLENPQTIGTSPDRDHGAVLQKPRYASLYQHRKQAPVPWERSREWALERVWLWYSRSRRCRLWVVGRIEGR